MEPRFDHDPARLRGPRGLRDPHAWHRDYPGRRIAGVCASLAENLEVSVSAVRLVFIVLAFIHGMGLILYGVLWLLLPDTDDQPATLDRWIRGARRFLGEDEPRRPLRHERFDPDLD